MVSRLDLTQTFQSASGTWYRGPAEIRGMMRGSEGFYLYSPGNAREYRHAAGVRVVDHGRVEFYRLAELKIRPVRDLQRLAKAPSDKAILAFIRKYGRLLNFKRWLYEIRELGRLEGAEDERYKFAVEDDLFGYGGDALHFAEWCRTQGYGPEADYMHELFRRLR